MKKIPTCLKFPGLVLCSIFLLSCDGQNGPSPAQSRAAEPPLVPAIERSETQKMHAFMDELYERNVAAWPQWETELGRKTDQQGEWNDYSDAYADEQLELARIDLENLHNHFDYDQLDANGKLSYDLFVYNIERAMDNAAWRRHDYVVDQFNGQISGLFAFLQNRHFIDTEKDAEDYVKRMAGMREVFEELAEQLRDRSDFGVATPAFAYADMIADIGRMTSGPPVSDGQAENPLITDFRKKLDALELGEEGYQQLERSAVAALHGPFREGADTLIAELLYQQALMENSFGVWSLPEGDAYYRNRIRHHTTLDLTADEIHQAGLDVLDVGAMVTQEDHH